jgi:hypothetical protein
LDLNALAALALPMELRKYGCKFGLAAYSKCDHNLATYASNTNGRAMGRKWGPLRVGALV